MGCATCSRAYTMAENQDDISAETAAFAERVADHLRAPEKLGASFDARLMEKVRREARSAQAITARLSPSWWRAERVVRFSPIGAIAVAAGVSIVVALSTLAVGARVWAKSGAPAARPAETRIGTRAGTA